MRRLVNLTSKTVDVGSLWIKDRCYRPRVMGDKEMTEFFDLQRLEGFKRLDWKEDWVNRAVAKVAQSASGRFKELLLYWLLEYGKISLIDKESILEAAKFMEQRKAKSRFLVVDEESDKRIQLKIRQALMTLEGRDKLKEIFT